MGEYKDREHYIPLRVSDLVNLLCGDREALPDDGDTYGTYQTSHRAGAGATGLSAQDANLFRQFCRLVIATYHFEYHAKLQELKDKGALRNFYDQSYIDALAQGEVYITQAWSGDVLQRNISDGTNYQFIIPEEGGTIWTDNFAIPSTASNVGDVHKLIDFFYRTDVAASLAEYIGYVSPVSAASSSIIGRACSRTFREPTTAKPTSTSAGPAM